MAIKIRETKVIDGKEYKDVIVYRSDKTILSKQEQKDADVLDDLIENTMRKIENDVEKNGLLELKGKSGVIELWYEVGRRLRNFIDSLDIPSNERKFLFRALYDHAGNLSPGVLTERAKNRPEQSYFSYFYKLGKYKKDDVVTIPWTIWHEVMDSPIFRENDVVTDWLVSKNKDLDSINAQEWLRPVFKAIRNKFRNVNVTVFSDEELSKKLDDVYHEIHPPRR